MAEFLARELQVGSIQITNSREEFRNYDGPRINYSDASITDEIWIRPYGGENGFLFEQTIRHIDIECFMNGETKAFFRTGGDPGFDLLAASFFLISRYEEYLPHSKDSYGRYAHQNSLAFREGFLHLPLVNLWARNLEKRVREKWEWHGTNESRFTFLPTYDIDIAWSYLHKGWWRNTGGFLRSLAKGKISEALHRLSVLRGKERDPFDAYDWLNSLHDKFGLKPYYFFLLAGERGRYDKNISPRLDVLRELVRHHVLHYPTGIHPSWKSGDDPSLLQREIKTLREISGQDVLSSRQHFIRFTMPETFRRLLQNDILFDFSMGYGTINGFRASVASPFHWYDLEREQTTELLLFPFCFMEANSYYELKHTPAQAKEEMRRLYDAVRSIEGTFIMIWHNSFLGTEKIYEGWREVYAEFITEVCSK